MNGEAADGQTEREAKRVLGADDRWGVERARELGFAKSRNTRLSLLAIACLNRGGTLSGVPLDSFAG